MDSSIIVSYLLIIGGIVVWALLLPWGKKVPRRVLDYANIFCGAFLLGTCFLNLLPEVYEWGAEMPVWHVKMGLAVLVGFLIQLLLELLTEGIEHGHHHCTESIPDTTESTEAQAYSHNHQHRHEGHPVTGLLAGLSLHAFIEGMPLATAEGAVNSGLLLGIVLHNIPLALVLVSLFVANGFGVWKSLALLALFGLMSPLGSLCNMLLLPANATLQALLMGLVVGILLHVSVSILFNEEGNRLTWGKVGLIVAAFAVAYFIGN